MWLVILKTHRYVVSVLALRTIKTLGFTHCQGNNYTCFVFSLCVTIIKEDRPPNGVQGWPQQRTFPIKNHVLKVFNRKGNFWWYSHVTLAWQPALEFYEKYLVFWYLSYHLTWHCSSISEDLYRFARNLQHLSTKLFLLLFPNNFRPATCKIVQKQ